MDYNFRTWAKIHLYPFAYWVFCHTEGWDTTSILQKEYWSCAVSESLAWLKRNHLSSQVDHLETAISGDPSHNQPPNADTIAYTSRILLKDPDRAVSCDTMQTQKWILTVSYWMDHWAPNGGARECTQRAKGICIPIGGTTLWTNHTPELLTLAA